MEFKSIIPGLSLGDYKVIPTKSQLFMFSALTWNRHQIHFNRDFAKEEGLPDVAVQRGLIGNFLAEYLSRWILDNGYLRKLKWKVLLSAFPGEELRCLGEIVSLNDDQGEKEIHCSLKVLNTANEQVAIGEAKLQLKA